MEGIQIKAIEENFVIYCSGMVIHIELHLLYGSSKLEIMRFNISGILFEGEVISVEKSGNLIFVVGLRKKEIEDFEGLSANELTVNLCGNNKLALMAMILNKIILDSPIW